MHGNSPGAKTSEGDGAETTGRCSWRKIRPAAFAYCCSKWLRNCNWWWPRLCWFLLPVHRRKHSYCWRWGRDMDDWDQLLVQRRDWSPSWIAAAASTCSWWLRGCESAMAAGAEDDAAVEAGDDCVLVQDSEKSYLFGMWSKAPDTACGSRFWLVLREVAGPWGRIWWWWGEAKRKKERMRLWFFSECYQAGLRERRGTSGEREKKGVEMAG